MKHFFFILCFCIGLGLHAQAIVSSSSIAIQGLLKNELGEPLSNISGLELDFKVYYLNTSNNETTIKSVSDEVKTDAYGVFNYVINLNETQVNTLSYYASYAKVTLGSTEIFDQQLRAVPYAIHAKNGYPTGTVLPYMGEEAPAGWLLCNGQNIPNTYFYENLIAIVGNTTPNLNAMFLRGTGTRSVGGKSYSGEALGGYGYDRNPYHRHNINITTSEAGEHRHALRRDSYGSSDGYAMYSTSNSDEGFYNENNDNLMSRSGNHSHNFSGNTSYQGAWDRDYAWEQRPVNYGVNYIIKI